MNYKIIGKYVKNLNFNIPNPKTFFLLSKNISNYKINIDIKSNQVKENIIEVLISLSLMPTKDDFEKIVTNIVFATIVEITEKDIKGLSNLLKNYKAKAIIVRPDRFILKTCYSANDLNRINYLPL